MDATPNHATHDELLIARLHGDDLTDAERARAVELVASCARCADLLADLAAISTALAELPAEPRPRSFALTPDMVPTSRAPRTSWPAAILGWARPLGGVLAAAGLAGVLVFGGRGLIATQGSAGNALTGSGENYSTTDTAGQSRAPAMAPAPAAAQSAQALGPAATAAASAAPATGAPVVAGAGATAGPFDAASAAPAASGATSGEQHAMVPPPPAATPALASGSTGKQADVPVAQPAASTRSIERAAAGGNAGAGNPPDPGLIALAGSGVALVLGLLLLAVSTLLSRRSRFEP